MSSDYHKVSYIDHNIICNEKLPVNIQSLAEMLEKSDREDPDQYFDIVDAYLVNVKNAYAAGMISKAAWNLLEKKYYFHALKVVEDEG